MIDQYFQAHIESLYSTYSIYYGNAQGATEPYHLMIKVADPEQPVVLCEDQGDAGQALFQFSTYAGDDPTVAMRYAEVLKNVVNTIKGTIGTDPNDYMIDNNITSGVRLISDGAGSLMVWGVIFETEIWWHKI